jgi:hypothetical protein
MRRLFANRLVFATGAVVIAMAILFARYAQPVDQRRVSSLPEARVYEGGSKWNDGWF